MSVATLIGVDTPIKIKNALSSLGFDVAELQKDERLPTPIRSHADTLLFALDQKIFVSASYKDKFPALFEMLKARGCSVISCECELGSEYPNDIAFNVLTVGKHAFGRFDFVAEQIKNELVEHGFSLCNVKQGYAKCSTAVIGENAIITADSSIAQAASGLGIDVLRVSNAESSIKLDGYAYGFIGGACALFEGTLYFCGNIELHPDYLAIKDFCYAHGVSLCSLSDDILCDVGGIFFIK